MSHELSADLDWLAFQYVSEELSADEVAQFEERLADDQAAREAVAEAMLLLQAVSAGARVVSPATVSPASTGRTWWQYAGWAAAGAAACVALVFAGRSAPQAQPVARVPQSTDLASAELALVWAQTNAYQGSPSAEVMAEEDASAIDVRDDREFTVPGWMLEALSGGNEAKPTESKES